MIIGLTGRNASGKGTVARWLVERGYHYASLSDAIRRWLAEQGVEATRDNLTAAGRQLRSEGGPGVLAERTLRALPAGRPCVVDSIRNPAEVEVLRRSPGFWLVEVVADERVRYERLRSRARAGDAASFEEFQRQEEAELTSASAAGQQLVATAALADETLRNDGSEDDLVAILQVREPQWHEPHKRM
ncbi:MAG: AAA family ATPase [Deltaproteobacteria bacterium]|nr:AAA family ATPase [Deltaproteobacteria bacterium]